MSQLPLANWQRYLPCLIKYGSPRKYLNLLRSYGHFVKCTITIPTLPSFLKVEISRHCTVNCRYCFPRKEEVYYPFLRYRELIDRLKETCIFVSLYDIGEPLHNTDVVEYIKYAHANNLGTVISTSLSVHKNDAFWQRFIASGLDYLIVSIDGITQEIYEHYRRQGNLELVLANLRKIMHYRQLADSRTYIEWQMIDFPWNKAEQRAARRLAREMGCNGFRLIQEAVKPRADYKKAEVIRRRNCLLPYVLFSVDAYNNVRLCYKIYDEDMTVGDLNNETFANIWNGDKIAMTRDKKMIHNRAGCRTCRE